LRDAGWPIARPEPVEGRARGSTSSPRAVTLSRRRRQEQLVALAPQNDPVRALLLIEVEPLAVVASDTFARDHVRTSYGAQLARLLADLAGLALGAAVDPEHRQVRQNSQRRPAGAEK